MHVTGVTEGVRRIREGDVQKSLEIKTIGFELDSEYWEIVDRVRERK